MQDLHLPAPSVATKRDCLYLVHRLAGLIAIPFMLISIMLAVGLTHTRLLNALSEIIYDSKPIPQVKLDDPVIPGSWDQALKLAKLATGKDARVITTRAENIVNVQAFGNHSHDPQVAETNTHTQLLIDTSTMEIVRVEDKTNSLISQGHGIHAIRFFGIEGFSLSTVSSIALLVLLISGGMLVWRDRRESKQYPPTSFWHVRLGQAIGVFIIIIVLTTLDFEFAFSGGNDMTATHPISAVQLNEPVRSGSIDQARHLAELAIGAAPRAVYMSASGELKFSEAGDGIDGKSVWINANTMNIKRVTDWHNDKQAFRFILHDGRWLGGMNALNINDVVALILLILVISGTVIFLGVKKTVGGVEHGNTHH